MKIGLSVLSSARSMVGFEIRKGLEPIGVENKLYFQHTIIVTFGFLFGYFDITFDTGEAIPFTDDIAGFEKMDFTNDTNEE